MSRSLPLDKWPEPDRKAWAEACRPHLRLQRGGRAADLKAVTRDDLARRYGRFLGFLERTGRLEPDRSALSCVLPDIVGEYVDEMRVRVSSVTAHMSIHKLRRVVEIIDPDFDLGWLKEIELDLSDRAHPQAKAHRLVSSGRIFEAGVALIETAETKVKATPLQRARMVRNGLLIAFLAVCPIRLKNVASLTVGETLVRQGREWWLLLPDEDTKAGRPDHRVLPDVLTQWIDFYMEVYKPIFPSADTAMWPSQYGGPMSYSGIYQLVVDTTRRELGKAICPHLFRHCVPYTIANIDGSRIGLASALLQHSDPKTTERHYNLATSVDSARIFESMITGIASHDLRAASRRTEASET